jgi:putative addiction module component (TIGR02574 family)
MLGLFCGIAGRTISDMTKAAKAVLANALRLDADERAEVAAEVLASLDGPADLDAERAWKAEIRKRIEAIDSGEVELEPWTAVKRRIEKGILGR